jgi:hypothetical protein
MENSIQAVMSSGIILTVISIGYFLYKICNHKAFVSKCCKQKYSMSLDIDDTSIKPLIESPIIKESKE